MKGPKARPTDNRLWRSDPDGSVGVTHGGTVNSKVYTHEFIDIIGSNRANYMHHMTANWCPMARDDRGQRCFGVWGVVGTTNHWPRVVNMWEEDGLDGLATALAHELGRPSLQDPKLEAWWNEAANFRSGGYDRVLIPAPWTRTIEELCADGVSGVAYAHDTIRVTPGEADTFLSKVRDIAVGAHQPFGWELVGALKTSMRRDDECIVIWALPEWQQWSEVEKARDSDPSLRLWRDLLWEAEGFERFLMCDAPLAPLKIGRQPERSDRTIEWNEPQ